MPLIRRDFLTGHFVTISEERGERPLFYTRGEVDASDENCPFCLKNKHLTPGDIYVSGDSRVRVIPNKYPAIADKSPAYGFHEVIIDTPNHTEKLKDFATTDVFTVLSVIRARLLYHNKNPRIKYVQIIKNEGLNAGASIFHSHWQLFALDFTPVLQRTIYKNLRDYNCGIHSCFLCDIQKNEGTLKICDNDYFFAYSPYASSYPHLVQIIPKDHINDFKDLSDCALMSLADMIKRALTALDITVPGVSYNICLFNMPNYKGHFFIQIIPRIGNLAGFEFATGCFINSVLPERSCAELMKRV